MLTAVAHRGPNPDCTPTQARAARAGEPRDRPMDDAGRRPFRCRDWCACLSTARHVPEDRRSHRRSEIPMSLSPDSLDRPPDRVPDATDDRQAADERDAADAEAQRAGSPCSPHLMAATRRCCASTSSDAGDPRPARRWSQSGAGPAAAALPARRRLARSRPPRSGRCRRSGGRGRGRASASRRTSRPNPPSRLPRAAPPIARASSSHAATSIRARRLRPPGLRLLHRAPGRPRRPRDGRGHEPHRGGPRRCGPDRALDVRLNGYEGTSLNRLDPVTGTWSQTWVDDQGDVVEFVDGHDR